VYYRCLLCAFAIHRAGLCRLSIPGMAVHSLLVSALLHPVYSARLVCWAHNPARLKSIAMACQHLHTGFPPASFLYLAWLAVVARNVCQRVCDGLCFVAIRNYALPIPHLLPLQRIPHLICAWPIAHTDTSPSTIFCPGRESAST